MTECGNATPKIYVGYIVYDWLDRASQFLVTALIMTAICRKLQSDFARVQPAILTLQTVWVALLGALVVALLSMSTAAYHYHFADEGDYTKAYELTYPIRGVQTTYCTLTVAGLLIASATMLKAFFSAPAYLRKGVRPPYYLAHIHYISNQSFL